MSRLLKLVGSFVFAAILIAAETAVGSSSGFGTIIPLQAHVFVLAFVLIYLTFSVGEVRDRLDALIAIERSRQSQDTAAT